ncbi:hypothetical protein G6F63_015424 [Rhizopus arrhizus]|nr:hypothetical protein G6F63_015424 [Rhizopus arrhizus]
MRPWQELGRDCLAEARGVGGAQSALQEPVDQLQQALLALRAAMDGLPSRGTQWRALAMPQVRDGFDTVMAGLMTLEQALQPLREAAAGLDAEPVAQHAGHQLLMHEAALAVAHAEGKDRQTVRRQRPQQFQRPRLP